METKFIKYWFDTQKWKIIRTIIILWANDSYQDFEIENFHWIFNTNNVWARLSELLKEWVVTSEYFPNKKQWYHRAKYKLTEEAILFYSELYKQETIRRVILEEFQENEELTLWEKLKRKYKRFIN